MFLPSHGLNMPAHVFCLAHRKLFKQFELHPWSQMQYSFLETPGLTFLDTHVWENLYLYSLLTHCLHWSAVPKLVRTIKSLFFQTGYPCPRSTHTFLSPGSQLRPQMHIYCCFYSNIEERKLSVESMTNKFGKRERKVISFVQWIFIYK